MKGAHKRVFREMEYGSAQKGNQGQETSELLKKRFEGIPIPSTKEESRSISPNPTLTNNNLASRRRSIDPTSLSILVVDNDKLTLRIAEKLLNKLNYSKVQLIESGAEALRMVQEGEPIDILLSDIHMPGVNGFQLAKEVNKINDNICILMMSGAEDLDTVYQSLRCGADHYIVKPLKESDLGSLWQSLYRKRKEKAAFMKLNREAIESYNLQHETKPLEEEIEKLKAQVERTTETPIRIIAEQIRTLLSQANLPADIMLSTILRNLKSIDLYLPVFQQLTSPESDLEPTSKRWLLDELNAPIIDILNPSDEKAIEWPTVQSPVLESARSKLRDWNFDVWKYSEEDLLHFLEEMFNDFNLLERFQVPQETFHNFILEVNRNYRKENPYHNFRHAFDVTQNVYLFLTVGGAASLLDYVEIFAILVAALVHDLGHPGLNNNFQIATNSRLAFLYNDTSVLENYHCNLAFNLLRNPEMDIFANLKPDDKKRARRKIIRSVLATDLASHMEIMGKWNAESPNFNKNEREHRTLLLEMLLKAADLANAVKDFDQAKHWATLVQEEFFKQGDVEKEFELVVSPFMDRDMLALEQLQLNFVNFLVIPLWESLLCVMPSIAPIVENLRKNRTKWEVFHKSEMSEMSGGET